MNLRRTPKWEQVAPSHNPSPLRLFGSRNTYILRQTRRAAAKQKTSAFAPAPLESLLTVHARRTLSLSAIPKSFTAVKAVRLLRLFALRAEAVRLFTRPPAARRIGELVGAWAAKAVWLFGLWGAGAGPR